MTADRIKIKQKKKWLLNKIQQKNCEYFIPHIELEEEDIEVEINFNINHKCPYCGNEDTEYGESNEDSKIIECSNCGKKYKISWCYEG